MAGLVRQHQGQLGQRKIWRGPFAKVKMPRVGFQVIWDLFAPSIQVVVLRIHIFQLVGLVCTLRTSCGTCSVYSSPLAEICSSALYLDKHVDCIRLFSDSVFILVPIVKIQCLFRLLLLSVLLIMYCQHVIDHGVFRSLMYIMHNVMPPLVICTGSNCFLIFIAYMHRLML
jgi:hypothetical protein